MRLTLALIGIGTALFMAGCKDKTAESSGGEPDSAGFQAGEPVLATASDTVEGLGEEFVAQLDQVGRALRGVVDETSAAKVSEIVPLACAQFKAIATRLEDLEVPGADTKAGINKEIEQREEEMARSLGDQEDFLNTLDPAARKIVKDAMGEFIQTMEQIRPVVEKYFLVIEDSVTPPPAEPDPGPAPDESVEAPPGQPSPE